MIEFYNSRVQKKNSLPEKPTQWILFGEFLSIAFEQAWWNVRWFRFFPRKFEQIVVEMGKMSQILSTCWWNVDVLSSKFYDEDFNDSWLFFGFRCCHFFANFLCDKNLRDIFFWLLQIIGTNMIFEEPESVKANCLDLGLMNEMLAVNKICEKRLYWHIENRERERLMEING